MKRKITGSVFTLHKVLNSATWKKGYNTVLIFASASIANVCKKSIMDHIPHPKLHDLCTATNTFETTFRPNESTLELYLMR